MEGMPITRPRNTAGVVDSLEIIFLIGVTFPTPSVRSAAPATPPKHAWEGKPLITQLPNYPITQLPNYPITQLPNYPITQLPNY